MRCPPKRSAPSSSPMCGSITATPAFRSSSSPACSTSPGPWFLRCLKIQRKSTLLITSTYSACRRPRSTSTRESGMCWQWPKRPAMKTRPRSNGRFCGWNPSRRGNMSNRSESAEALLEGAGPNPRTPARAIFVPGRGVF